MKNLPTFSLLQTCGFVAGWLQQSVVISNWEAWVWTSLKVIIFWKFSSFSVVGRDRIEWVRLQIHVVIYNKSKIKHLLVSVISDSQRLVFLKINYSPNLVWTTLYSLVYLLVKFYIQYSSKSYANTCWTKFLAFKGVLV